MVMMIMMMMMMKLQWWGVGTRPGNVNGEELCSTIYIYIYVTLTLLTSDIVRDHMGRKDGNRKEIEKGER